MANGEWRIANSEADETAGSSNLPFAIRYSPASLFATRHSPLLNNYQRLAEFDRLAVLDENLRHGARARRRNLVHRLHRLDDQQRLPDRHLGADLDERLGAGL